MTKPKPPVKPQPRLTSQAVKAAAENHPWWSLTTLGIVVAILAGLAPGIFWAIDYYLPRKEFRVHLETTARTDAWRDVQSFKRDATVARNRVNDCALIKERKGGMSPLEKAACAQYQDDMDAANAAWVEAQKNARVLSKEK